MLTIGHILIPTDLSEESRRPFPRAASLAERYDADLHILNVPQTASQGNDGFPIPADRFDEWLSTAGQTGARVNLDSVPIRQHQVGALSPQDGILECVRQENIDLVVMGTRGRQGVNRMLFGSVTEDVIRRAPCPVLTVQADSPARARHPVRHVVVPVDFSEASTVALRHAKEIALTHGAELDLLHVVEERVHPSAYGPKPTGVPGSTILDRLEQSLAVMARKNVGYEHARVNATVGHPPAAILDYVRDSDVDLVVSATHGRTGLSRLLIGSVTESVIRQAPVPVFVVRPPHMSLLPSTHDPLELATE